MAVVGIPFDQPTPPSKSRVKTYVPLQSSVLRRMSLGATHAATWRCAHVGGTSWNYEGTLTPIEQETPLGLSQEGFVFIESIPARCRYLLVSVRLQAGRIKGGAFPSLAVSLEEMDGTEIDAGFTFNPQSLLRGQVTPYRWEPFRVWTPLRSPASLASQTTPRMLGVDDFQGSPVKVKFDSSQCRLLSADVLSYVPIRDDQVFTP